MRASIAFGLAALVVAGCSGGAAPSGGGETGSSTSSPFSVGAVPAGYELVVAGMGTGVGDWGEDSTGTVEPYTVLSPDGRATGEEVVRVALTGYEGYQGGLAQASLGYLSEHTLLTIDGAEAIFAPPETSAVGRRWADLVVVRGDDLAVRVSSPRGTLAELTAIAKRVVVPDDRREAPTVTDPPGGLRVVGSLDVDGVLAASASVAPHTNQVPGPRSAHAAGWIRSGSQESDRLSVLTVPGRSLDLAAVHVREREWQHVTRTARARVVDGRPALITTEEWPEYPDSNRLTVMVEASWGDVVVVSASGTTLPSEEELIAMAASVTSTDDVAWGELVTEANGGPGLHADLGRHELARGRIGAIDWLLQDGPPHSLENDRSLGGVDPCLKLSDGERLCADSGTALGGGGDWYGYQLHHNGLSFVVVGTQSGPGVLRITTSTAFGTAELVAVPAGGVWGAVVFVADPGFATCRSQDPPAPGTMRVELLDDDGDVAGCLFSPG